MRKLTQNQVEAIRLMANGWELGCSWSTGGGIRYWLQQGGCGRGGDSRKVNASTVSGLFKRSLVDMKKNGFPTTTYELTPAGREMAAPSPEAEM